MIKPSSVLIPVIFKDKMGKTLVLKGKIDQSIKDFLYKNKIPRNAVVVEKNGVITSEDIPIKGDDKITMRMVRGYNLPYFRNIKTITQKAKNPIYTKSFIWFEKGGVTKKEKQFSKNGFVKYVEKSFLQTIKDEKMIQKGDGLAFGFSGGKDSLSLMLLFQRLKRFLPKFNLIAYTVADVLSENLPSFQYTKKVCKEFDVKQKIIRPKEIEKLFHLKKPVLEIAHEMTDSSLNMRAIYTLHHIMRRMIENDAQKLKINKILLGLNLEDLVAGLIGGYTTGHLMTSLPIRKIKKFTYIFPLWKLTKKEIDLYVNLTAEPYSGQEPPGPWDLVPLDRGFYYAFSDFIQDIWPGIDHYLYEGFRKIYSYYKDKIKFTTCQNCKGTILLQDSQRPKLCDVCALFKKLKVLEQ